MTAITVSSRATVGAAAGRGVVDAGSVEGAQPIHHGRVTIEMTLAMKPGLANGALRLLLEAGSSELLSLFGRRARALYSRA